jgi:Adenosine-deaminase (editase) domain
MKCLPQNKISQAQGVVLHDWHAEVLVIRSFNRFLLDECHALAISQKQSSEYVRLRSREERTESHYQPFALNDGINLHMYCSEAPCKSLSTPLLFQDPLLISSRRRCQHGAHHGRSRRLHTLGATPRYHSPRLRFTRLNLSSTTFHR